jgi:DNA-directed RNA polymerase subunit RPC12/RpoP
MFMSVTCPTCGHKCRVPESTLGQRAKCPACANHFQCGSVSPPSLATTPLPDEKPAPVQAAAQARAVQAQPDQNIHYRCPRCTRSLESPADMVGQKVNCPDCGQRLRIPRSSELPSVATSTSTPLTAEKSGARGASVEVTAVPLPAPPAPARRESCLECGKDVTDRPRIHVCPDCGSLFCSAMCYREHRFHAHPSRRW